MTPFILSHNYGCETLAHIRWRRMVASSVIQEARFVLSGTRKVNVLVS